MAAGTVMLSIMVKLLYGNITSVTEQQKNNTQGNDPYLKRGSFIICNGHRNMVTRALHAFTINMYLTRFLFYLAKYIINISSM